MKEINFGHTTESDNAYSDVVTALFGTPENVISGSYLVQIQMRYGPEDDFDDITEILIVNQDNTFRAGNFYWPNDWWEGQSDIRIVAFAKVEDIDITKSFPFPAE